MNNNIDSIEEFKIKDNVEAINVRDLIKKSKPGFIAYLISGYWPSQNNVEFHEETNIEDDIGSDFIVRGKTTLREIKDNIDDFDIFLKEFNIPENENLSISLRDLVDKYGIYMGDIKTYVEEHLK